MAITPSDYYNACNLKDNPFRALPVQDADLNDKLASFNYKGMSITNLEMETAGIYGLAKLLGHKALSMNAIIANRATGEFTQNPKKVVDDLIAYTLEKLIED